MSLDQDIINSTEFSFRNPNPLASHIQSLNQKKKKKKKKKER
jgi:hypothetical protein